ncbi:CHAT domain-containing protein [Sedimentitalea sp. JM2-8]|uniref:CHAT domain-containing protein n=1 Tax=Sedimentitalea xiamensis TaxID=3050037 RepID=A0ABT7F8X2_9RHOB|nr:CHAT domain-containing protein [Sedimentitalea xiamensis]MDK3071550.1 CHAT domain-containing protein [Sedimentitalea xiamensis]
MANIFLPGQPVSFSKEEQVWPPASDATGDSDKSAVLKVKVIGAGRLPHARGGDAKATAFEVPNVRPTDIVEIELKDGLKIWQSVESTETDFQGAESRSGADQALLVPRQLAFKGQGADSRGLVSHVVRAIRVLRGDPVQTAGKLSAVALARKIENTIDPGFRKCERLVKDGEGTIRLSPVKTGDVPADQKILVFLHGTFSSTEGSFGDLALAPYGEVWQKLEAAHPGGIYALQHKSVTESPVRNAIDLVEALPKGASVSLMSHSRGGMIAELVSRAARKDVAEAGAIDDMDIEIFQKLKDRAAQLNELKKLREVLDEKQLRVDRVVRVAGPIAGTTLASERLDRYLSIALNVFELIPVLKRTGAADLMKAFLMALIRTKADPASLPGLEAMMPTSPLTRMLNREDVRYGNGLWVIGGDTQGAGVLQRLGVLAADLFFRADHDFVVDTASMTRGAARDRQAKPFLFKGPEVSHFSYFHEPASQREIVGAAIQDDTSFVFLPASRGVASGEIPESEKFPDLASRAGNNDPVCFVLPGVMGSHLSQAGDWIWTNPLKIPFGGLDRLRIEQPKVTSSGSLKTHYWDLARYLSRTHKVIPFDYDWRLSILEQGHSNVVRKLGNLVEAELKRTGSTNQPIRFMAHSMGGLLVRALFQTRPDLWARVKQRPGSRFVMLGTPNGGAFSMMRTLLGRDSAIRKLEMVDIKHDLPALLSIVAGMHGALQLLPSDEDGRYLSDQFWDQLHSLHGEDWVKPTREALEIARKGHRALAEHELDPELTCYVAGFGASNTPSSVQLDPAAEGADRIKFFATPQGDGTVTWKTGIPKNIPTWYLDAIHGDLPRTESAFPAYLELLRTGTTEKLTRQPLFLSRADGEAETEVVDTPIEIYPDTDEILDDFLGSSSVSQAPLKKEQKPVHVSLLHGNLRFASYPLAVGHYIDAPMMGAEEALDESLDRELSKVRDLGLYPGEIETCEVILREDQSPKGAVVIGLGTLGTLSPGGLKDSFRQAVLRYCLIVRERRKEKLVAGSDEDPIELSTLLIGHQGTNMSIQQSVEAILQAVSEANRILGDGPRIGHLQFVELYDDTAHEAASALDNVRSLGRVGRIFEFDGQVRKIQDARVRTYLGRQTDWWRRITVTQADAESNTLKYVAVSGTAKSEHTGTVIQPRVFQDLLNQRDTGTATNREVGKLLFELLVPSQLKTFARENQNITLELDEHTAVYPWELMEDDFRTYEFVGARRTAEDDDEAGEENKPMVIRAPVIRKLITSGPRIPRASGTRALVVGDPKSNLSPLDGARREALGVAQLLKENNWTVEDIIRPENGFDIIKSIMLRPSRLIHLAGHGVYGSGAHEQTGMVLGEGLYLTVAEIEQMRYVPELVFLNCCHLGHSGRNVSEIAASLSVAFIKRGVRAVIAAGWEVDDKAAMLFAETFYTAMLDGVRFGRAIHLARRRVFEEHPDKNTWGAYQCYGDPSYKFDETADDSAHETDEIKYYSVYQALRAAQNIAESAASAREKRALLMARLEAIEESSRPSWYAASDWCHAMGRAYARLDAFDRAISYFEKSIDYPDACGSFDAFEMREDLRVQQATRAWLSSAPGDDRKAAADVLVDVVQKALECYDRLDQLTEGRKTTHRECLKGTALKRLMQTKPEGSRKTALKNMTDQYKSAMEMAFQSDPDRIHLDAGINWLVGVMLSDVALRGQDGKSSATESSGVSVDVWLDRIFAESVFQDRAEPCFKHGIVQAQTEVLRGLNDASHATDQSLSHILSTIDKIWRRGGSFQQAQSLRDQITFIKMMMGQIDPQRSEWLNRIERHVCELTEGFGI